MQSNWMMVWIVDVDFTNYRKRQWDDRVEYESRESSIHVASYMALSLIGESGGKVEATTTTGFGGHRRYILLQKALAIC